MGEIVRLRGFICGGCGKKKGCIGLGMRVLVCGGGWG